MYQVYAENPLQVEQRIELTCVPDNALSHGRAKESQQNVAKVIRIAKALLEGVLGNAAFLLKLGIHGRLPQGEADIQR